MSLKLIKEANVLSTLDASSLTAFKELQKATGKTIAEVVAEAFTPNPNDYRQWLRTVIGYADDEGLKLDKNTFYDIAGATLENDPANPPVSMHAAILNKLWADYKASKQHAKVQKLARSQEEEELDSVDDLGDTHEPGAPRESDDDARYSATGKFGVADRDDDDTDDTDGEDEVTCPECGCKFHPESDDDSEEGDDEYHEPQDELGSRVGGTERIGRMGNGPDGGHVGDEDLAYQEEELVPSRYVGRTPAVPYKKADASRDPEAVVRQVLSAPREHMNAALKDIESDGAAAWTASKLPENPHAKGSMAHRKWATGFKKAMKSHLGLDAAPVAAKPKRR